MTFSKLSNPERLFNNIILDFKLEFQKFLQHEDEFLTLKSGSFFKLDTHKITMCDQKHRTKVTRRNKILRLENCKSIEHGLEKFFSTIYEDSGKCSNDDPRLNGPARTWCAMRGSGYKHVNIYGITQRMCTGTSVVSAHNCRTTVAQGTR